MQNELIDVLFGEFIAVFDYFFADMDRQFINNLVIALQYNVFYQGQVIQTSQYDCQVVYLVKSGYVAVCESTCYQEPILVYGKGAVINLYQILMDRRLPFTFISVCDSEFRYNADGEILIETKDHLSKRSFLRERGLDSDDEETAKQGSRQHSELYSLDKKTLFEFCEVFPNSAELLQKYAIEQVEHLSLTR